MANEKRLISVDAFKKAFYVDDDCDEIRFYVDGTVYVDFRAVQRAIDEAPTVDAVEAKKYEELVGMYHELRENFVDFVCSGVPNVAPYCLNRCDGCCDAYGWCRQSNLCKGFNPAEVILYRCAKMDGDGNENT